MKVEKIKEDPAAPYMTITLSKKEAFDLGKVLSMTCNVPRHLHYLYNEITSDKDFSNHPAYAIVKNNNFIFYAQP